MSAEAERRTSERSDAWTVGRVADALGVTVRTLHHYDATGLLVPTGRSGAGYRLYTDADVERLQRIVVYRRLGFALDEIADLLEGGADVVAHLRRRRATVMDQLDEMQDLVRALDIALEAEMTDRPVTAAEMRELFGDDFDDAHQQAEQRWGDTAEWQQSASRTAGYTRADWEEIKSEADEIHAALLDAFRSGAPATGEQAMNAAERHRRHIDRRFYDCPPSMHRQLAELYVSDPRYVATYDESMGAPGFAAYVHAAMHANADRRER